MRFCGLVHQDDTERQAYKNVGTLPNLYKDIYLVAIKQ